MAQPSRVESTAKRKRLDPAEREAEIVDAASGYFSDVGFGGGMRELAARIGVSHALLFRYFPTKEALVDRVYERMFVSRWKPEWDELLGAHTPDFREQLVRFYAAYLDAIDRREWARIFVYGGLAGVDINQRYLSMIRRKVVAPVASQICRAAEEDVQGTVYRRAIELSWGLHGEIFYLPVRRWIYGVKVDVTHEDYAALVVGAFFDGAPNALARERA